MNHQRRPCSAPADPLWVSDPGRRFGGVLLPTTCPGCRRVGSAPCPVCIGELLPPSEGKPVPGLDTLVALVSYEGAGAELIRRLKFANHRDALPAMARALAEILRRQLSGGPGVDAVTWVPTTTARRRVRGFDQAELIAVAVASELGLRSRASLGRLDTSHQIGRNRVERLHGPTLVAKSPCEVDRWLVVDDVVTTGASMAAAARALRGAGAGFVHGAALARTP